MKEIKRNYGIDLLRLVLMYMVCVLHTLVRGGVLAASTKGTYKYGMFLILEIFCFCAVDGFAIISGYTAVDKPQRYHKIASMWLQVFFYSFLITVFLTIVGINSSFSAMQILECALPVSSSKYWYFTAYFVLFFATPVLNKFISSIDIQTGKKAFIILLILFSFIEFNTGSFVTHRGYSTIWLIILYLIGALMKKIQLFEKRKSATLIMIWAGCILLTFIMKFFFNNGQLIGYVSPTILLSGMIMVILFSRMKANAKIISKLSPLAFGIYLLQLNVVIWSKMRNAL